MSVTQNMISMRCEVLLVKQNTILSSSKRFPKGQVKVYVLVWLHIHIGVYKQSKS